MKAPERRQASSGAGEQLTLLHPPPFCPTYPKQGSLPWRALHALLAGNHLDHGDFIESTDSWRLAAAIHELRKHGWPVETVEIQRPSRSCPTRVIARYELSADCISQTSLADGGGSDGR